MTFSDHDIHTVKTRYAAIRPFLNEKGRRLWAAAESSAYGRGGISLVCKATGLSTATVHKGIKEFNDSSLQTDRVRKKGAGRKKSKDTQEGLLKALDDLVDPTAKGNPMSPLRWTSKSVRNLSDALGKQGFQVSYKTVSRLLHEMGYSLQANRKSLEGPSHVDRNAQFQYLNERVKIGLNSKTPVVSVDTKKKENIGNFKNGGQEISQRGTPIKVNDHDFPDKRLGKVSPYGVYDIGKNKGWVSVGISADTAEFAVNSIRTWWYRTGILSYSGSPELIITADCGGSNGYRVRLWKLELQKFADETGLKISVHHFPLGTSKWNKIEHRLFSYISKNWRGKPLITREAVISLIANTRTEKGLEVEAMLDENQYDKGKKVSDMEFATIHIQGHSFHPEWNYSILPRTHSRNGGEIV